MVTSARQVAAELRDRIPRIDQKRLHKLLYYCQGYHLATYGEALFSERVCCWDMCPVVGQLWKSEQDHGVTDTEPILDEGMLNTIGYVASKYGDLTGTELEHLTHSEAPWLAANEGRKPRGTTTISTPAMRDHFRGVEKDDLADEGMPDPGELADYLARASSTAEHAEHPDPDTVESLNALLRVSG